MQRERAKSRAVGELRAQLRAAGVHAPGDEARVVSATTAGVDADRAVVVVHVPPRLPLSLFVAVCARSSPAEAWYRARPSRVASAAAGSSRALAHGVRRVEPCSAGPQRFEFPISDGSRVPADLTFFVAVGRLPTEHTGSVAILRAAASKYLVARHYLTSLRSFGSGSGACSADVLVACGAAVARVVWLAFDDFTVAAKAKECAVLSICRELSIASGDAALVLDPASGMQSGAFRVAGLTVARLYSLLVVGYSSEGLPVGSSVVTKLDCSVAGSPGFASEEPSLSQGLRTFAHVMPTQSRDPNPADTKANSASCVDVDSVGRCAEHSAGDEAARWRVRVGFVAKRRFLSGAADGAAGERPAAPALRFKAAVAARRPFTAALVRRVRREFHDLRTRALSAPVPPRASDMPGGQEVVVAACGTGQFVAFLDTYHRSVAHVNEASLATPSDPPAPTCRRLSPLKVDCLIPMLCFLSSGRPKESGPWRLPWFGFLVLCTVSERDIGLVRDLRKLHDEFVEEHGPPTELSSFHAAARHVNSGQPLPLDSLWHAFCAPRPGGGGGGLPFAAVLLAVYPCPLQFAVLGEARGACTGAPLLAARRRARDTLAKGRHLMRGAVRCLIRRYFMRFIVHAVQRRNKRNRQLYQCLIIAESAVLSLCRRYWDLFKNFYAWCADYQHRMVISKRLMWKTQALHLGGYWVKLRSHALSKRRRRLFLYKLERIRIVHERQVLRSNVVQRRYYTHWTRWLVNRHKKLQLYDFVLRMRSGLAEQYYGSWLRMVAVRREGRLDRLRHAAELRAGNSLVTLRARFACWRSFRRAPVQQELAVGRAKQKNMVVLVVGGFDNENEVFVSSEQPRCFPVDAAFLKMWDLSTLGSTEVEKCMRAVCAIVRWWRAARRRRYIERQEAVLMRFGRPTESAALCAATRKVQRWWRRRRKTLCLRAEVTVASRDATYHIVNHVFRSARAAHSEGRNLSVTSYAGATECGQRKRSR
ncbi:hypothetical protein DIPPA_13490 [Diplonema papillatum]|nr:hypothetical protein DIPPA_13490 [Diplonema papillatum]